MKSDKLVSVIIATYNMGQFLPMAVKSVLDQTYSNLEVHVVDDGSFDHTRGTIKGFLVDKRVKYHYQANHGRASARNRGIRESKGEYIAFLDADDMWMPRKLEKQLPLFDAAGVIGVIYSSGICMNEKGEVIPAAEPIRYHGKIAGRLLVENCVPFDSAVVRRECFDVVGEFDESLRMGDDYDLWLRISAKYEFNYLNEPTFYYRVWSGQVSKNYLGRYEWGIKIMKNFLETHPNLIDEETVKEAWAHTYVGRGDCLMSFEKDRLKAFKDYLRALRYKPTYLPAWKEIVRLLLR
jgi:glycosyltransferase involved in cell wall biosynthesis